MSEGFQKNIQNWVSVDNKIKALQNQVKELRSQRNDLTSSIFSYAENNNLENAVIQISDGKLKFANVKQTSPLTYSLVEEALKDCIESEEAVKNIIKHIKSKRQTSFKYDIKRSYA